MRKSGHLIAVVAILITASVGILVLHHRDIQSQKAASNADWAQYYAERYACNAENQAIQDNADAVSKATNGAWHGAQYGVCVMPSPPNSTQN